MDDGEKSIDSLKESIKKKIKAQLKEELKQELLNEIYEELRREEGQLTTEISSSIRTKTEEHKKVSEPEKKEVAKEVKEMGDIEKLTVNVPSILKVASHALKYANKNIPKEQWVEVIGLLAGKVDKNGVTLNVKDAYPMGHGSAIFAEIKDYDNYVRAFKDIKKRGLFICGWYHSHPSYGTFMSDEDFGTQARYQKLWDKAIALVIDPYEIDGTSFGFEIFRANLRNRKWFSIPYKIKGKLSPKTLPELLEFINPIIDGKAIYLEYDEK